MTERLREEMLRVGETAPPIHVPGDLWALGRRARRRDRLVSGVVALSVIGLIFAVSMLGWPGLGGRGDVAPVSPAGDEGAVPSTLYGVPERLTSNEEAGTVWKSNVAEADLAIGRGSVAFAAGGSPLPVVVTAADGRYHPLVLPGWIGTTIAGAMMNPAVPLALSPDGRQLAYAWVEFSGEAVEGSGIRVLDLERGQLRSIALEGAAARSLGWSPDSRWLVWSGQQPQNWTKSSFGGRNKSAGGRIAPNATVSEPIPVRNESNQSVSIGSSGEAIVFGQSGRLEAIAPNGMATVVTDLQGRSTTGTGVVSPHGTQVALGTFEQGSSASFLRPPRPGVVPEVTERELAKDLDLYPGGAAVQPLGWLDDQLVLVEVTPANNADPSYGRRHLVVMTAPNVPEEDWTYRVMTRFADDAGQTSSVSVAVDLMTLEHPTADFPPPDWPWSDERKALVIGLSVAAVLGCLLLGRRWLRRSRRTLR